MISSGIRFYTLLLRPFKFKVTIKMLKNENKELEQIIEMIKLVNFFLHWLEEFNQGTHIITIGDLRKCRFCVSGKKISAIKNTLTNTWKFSNKTVSASHQYCNSMFCKTIPIVYLKVSHQPTPFPRYLSPFPRGTCLSYKLLSWDSFVT